MKTSAKISRNALTVSLLALVLLSHATSIAGHRFFAVQDRWDRSTVELKVLGRVLARARIFVFADFAIGDTIDRATALIAELGYVAKFYARQFPPFLFEGRASPQRRFYFREEVCLQYADRLARIRKDVGTSVGDVIARARAGGAEVVLVPLPTKISIERELLPADLPPCELTAASSSAPSPSDEAPYPNYRVILDQAAGHAVDLFEIFSRYRQSHPGENLWVPSDSHWASLGVAVTAAAVIDRLRAQGWNLGKPSIRKVSESDDNRRDMYTYTRIPRWLVAADPTLRWNEPLYLVDSAKPETTGHGRVILAGTSYSTRLVPGPFGFGEVLAKAVGRPLVDVSVSGGGAAAALLRLKERGDRLRRGDLLIWEFPLRNYPKAGELGPVLDWLNCREKRCVE